jgi:hypothetical protein
MTKIFYKAIYEDRTYIRASTNPGFQSFNMERYGMPAFSSKPGPVPAVKIEKPEYDFILAAKKARTDGNSPSDSWAFTADLVAPDGDLVSPVEGAAARLSRRLEDVKSAGIEEGRPFTKRELVEINRIKDEMDALGYSPLAAKEAADAEVAAFIAQPVEAGPVNVVVEATVPVEVVVTSVEPVVETPVLEQYSPLKAADAKAKREGKRARLVRSRKAVEAGEAPVVERAVKAPKAKAAKAAPAKKAPSVNERIWKLIERPQGVTVAEVMAALGWKRAGKTTATAVKAAPFPVRREKDGASFRYFRAEG